MNENGDDEDLDLLDWDELLDGLEDDLGDDAAAPGAPTTRAAEEARPLYRPPSPDETFERREPVSHPVPMDDLVDDDDEVIEATRIAAIPQELIDSLVRGNEENERPTKRPPAAPAPKPRAPSRSARPVDLDFDDLLAGLDDETRVYSMSSTPPPSGDRDSDEGPAPLFGARPPIGTGSIPSPKGEEAAADEGLLEPFAAAERFEADQDDVVSSFTPRQHKESDAALLGLDPDDLDELAEKKSGPDVLGIGETSEPLPKTRVASAADAPRGEDDEPLPKTAIATTKQIDAALDLDDESEEDGPPPKTAIATTGEIIATLDLDDESEEDPPKGRVADPKRPGLAPISTKPAPTGPIPGRGVAKPAVGKPGITRPRRPGAKLPPIPRPGGLPPGLPKAGLPRPGKLPPIPKPGGFPRPDGIERPGVKPPPGFPKPGAAAAKISSLAERLRNKGALGLPPAKRPAAEGEAPARAPDEVDDTISDQPAIEEGAPRALPSERPTPIPEAHGVEAPTDEESGLAELDSDLDDLLESTPPPEGASVPPARESAPPPPPPSSPAALADEPESESAALLAELREDADLPPEGQELIAAEDDDLPSEGQELIAAEDDDEMLIVGDDDDDDDEMLIVGDDDDDDEMLVVAGGEDDEDWDDEDQSAIEAAEAEQEASEAAAAAAKKAEDRGAAAARRTVRAHRVRDEHFPLIGDDDEALRLRKRLLCALAEEREGEFRARIQVAAAELAEQLGDMEEARELYELALKADGNHVVALRALRRDATRREDWDALARLFTKEAALDLSTQERAAAWTGLAEIHLSRRKNPAAAQMAARKALEIQPSSITATLLLAESRWHLGKGDPLEAFPAAREIWNDPDARAALAIEEARAAESRGDAERARELFTWANEVDPEALDGWFGRARNSSRKETDPKGAVEALATIAAYCGGNALGEAILTRASRVATRLLGDPGLGVQLLAGATGVVALRARADAAHATGQRPLMNQCLEAWAAAAGGTDRALALVNLAESRASQGDLDGAEEALRDAALADGSLGTIRVVREVIARRSGDVSRLADAVESGGSLAAAARVVRDPTALARERDLLDEALEQGISLVTADVLSLDVAAAQSDQQGIDESLRRQADRVPPEQRIGSLLVMTERAIDRDDWGGAEALLTEARQIVPGSPLVLRPLGRLALRHDAAEAAALFMEEASTSSGSRAAHAATQAGRVLVASGGDALSAYRRALDASPGYRPGAWALRPLAMQLGDPLTLAELYEQLAATATSPLAGAAELVRSALLRADADPAAAGAVLERARVLAPDDAVLQSLLMRLAGSTSAVDRAKMLVEGASRAPPDLARVFRIQAAAAYEDAGDHTAAAAEYRMVLEEHPDDPIAGGALDRTEIAADEVARVASRRFAAVKAAESDAERTLALEELATLDLLYRDDPASAVLSLQAILENAPGHLPSLRKLQRYFAEQNRSEDAAHIVAAMARHVQDGADVTAHTRLARRLILGAPDATGDAADELLLATAERAELDLWLAPRVLAAAREAGNTALARKATAAIATVLGAADERASARIRAAELESGATRIELLREAVTASPTHPLAAVLLAEACEETEDREAAADAWEVAGGATEVDEEGAARLYRAGVLWQEIGQPDRARAALARASARDVTFEDTFERLHALLEEADDKEGLAELYAARLTAGGDTPEIVDLYLKQAKLRTEIRDLAGAKAALRSALALTPENLEGLRDLANLSLEDEDWRGAAEVLIRIARIRKDREELRWVFFTLGDIYDQHMPDARRAEAAFRRVLKLFPQDLQAMERLATLYANQNEPDKAAQVLSELAQLDADPESSRGHRLRLASIYETAGDARKAESTLEDARRASPTDLGIVRALADFYERQNASNALTMHMSRAVNDFRHAIDSDLGDAAAWPGLVEVLTWSGKTDAAAVATSAAQAIGIVNVEMSKLVDPRGGAPGTGQAAASSQLDELLAPTLLSAPLRAVFKIAGDALEKALPFDASAYRAEKIPPRDTTIRPIAMEVAHWFGYGSVELYTTTAAPRVCVPVYSKPVTILIGSELLGITDDREKLFVLVRAFKIAKAQLSIVVRAQPSEILALMGGLVQSYDPHHVPAGVDPAHVEEAARRVAKNVQRKVRDELGPLVFEMAGRPGYAPAELAMAASEWGNRIALLAAGSAPAAVSSLAKLSGERALPTEPPALLAMVLRFPEASALLNFSISDAHFEARARCIGG